MKKTNLTAFDAEVQASPTMAIQSDEYLSQLYINKIFINPLQKLDGNIESKTGRDCYMHILEGSGSMEVNGTAFPVSAGDVVLIRGSEKFTVVNDSLNAVLQFVSVVSKK